MSTNDMETNTLNNLTKSQLINLVLKLNANIEKLQKQKPVPAPRKSVKQMVQDYEDNIIQPPLEFRDKPVPAPRKNVKQMVQDYEDNIIQPPLEFRDKPVPLPRTKKPVPLPRTKIEQLQQALKGYTKSFEISIINNKDPLTQLQNTRKAVEYHIMKILTSMKGLKFIETLKVTFKKLVNGEIVYQTAYFNSKPQTIINNVEIPEALQSSQQQILNIIAQWVSNGSGWTIESVDNHHLNIVQYKPMNGSSYIKLPQELRNSSKGLINMKNEDNECFRWCHIRCLNPQDKNPQRIKKSDKQYIQDLDYTGIEFPVTTKQYNKIEKQNEIRINVFGYENKQPYPIFVSKEKYNNQMNLLLITEDDKKHYVIIKDFNSFMYNQTKHKESKHFCMHCLQCFSSERVLNNHKDNCIQVNGIQAVKMPDEDNNILKFNNFHKQQPVPFVIYADFEAITEKISSCQPNNNKSYTEAYQKHTDCGYGYKIVCCYDDKYSKPVTIYRGEKAVYKFMEAMLEEVKYCKKIMKKEFNKPLRMTKEDEEEFQKANECHICNKKYTNEDIKVRDHCHITGKYRGSTHQECNLKLRVKPEEIKIPVIFHNLRGYDSHFIMQEIGEIVKKHTYINKNGKETQMNINAIPNNMEKYMAFMFGNNLVFLDSFQFMSSGLDKLVSNLPRKSLKYTSQKFKGKKLDLMARKGVYPYDYMDSFDKFNEKLPMKEKFYSVLNNEHISDEDYKHTQNVWNTFSLKNMYIDLDLKMTKVHRALDEFNQSPWLKQHIDFNTEKRKNAKNAFEKDFFKLMNNSVFGKTMENIRKRVDVRLVTDENKLLKYASKPTYVSSKIFNENLVAVHKIKETLTLNRPAYLGMCILDLSKTLMYDFHYNYIKNKYGEKAKSLFTDTDSLTYEIEAEDVYQDFWDDKNKFDNSHYPESSPYFDKTNKKVIGKFKDEAAGVPICEFVGLRSKMYSYIKDNQKGGKTAKGIKKNVIKKDIQHENYKETLFNNKQMYHKMKTIRSESHQLGSYEINKVSLSCFDDKRYIHEDGKTSYAYGHKNIQQKNI